MTRYRVFWNGGSGPRLDQKPATDSFFDWQWINATVQLKDHAGNLFPAGAGPMVKYTYYGAPGLWVKAPFGTLQNGQVSMEMMPSGGLVAFYIDDLNQTAQRKDASPMNSGAFPLVFQSGRVCDLGWNIVYYRQAGFPNVNTPFPASGKLEALPSNVLYVFHNEGDRIGPLTVVAGQSLCINANGTTTANCTCP